MDDKLFVRSKELYNEVTDSYSNLKSRFVAAREIIDEFERFYRSCLDLDEAFFNEIKKRKEDSKYSRRKYVYRDNRNDYFKFLEDQGILKNKPSSSLRFVHSSSSDFIHNSKLEISIIPIIAGLNDIFNKVFFKYDLSFLKKISFDEQLLIDENQKNKFPKSEKISLKSSNQNVLKNKSYDIRGIKIQLAESYVEQGKLEDAKKIYLSILELQSNNIEALKGLGWLYFFDTRFNEAIYYFEEALKLDRDDSDAISGLATLYQKINSWRKSILILTKALSSDKNCDNVLLMQSLLKCYQTIRDEVNCEKVINDIERYNKLYPTKKVIVNKMFSKKTTLNFFYEKGIIRHKNKLKYIMSGTFSDRKQDWGTINYNRSTLDGDVVYYALYTDKNGIEFIDFVEPFFDF